MRELHTKQSNRKRDLHCTNVTIKQKQSARINYITITQKKECTIVTNVTITRQSKQLIKK